MSRREDWARWLGIAFIVVVLAVAIVNGVRGRPVEPHARVPAATVMADAGPAGVVWIRDGAIVRIDRQSPPGRMVIPRPGSAPWPDGLAVGRHRVWVSTQGLVRGYSQGGRSVRAFRVTETDPLLMAEGRGFFWAVAPFTSSLHEGELAERPLRLRAIDLPCAARDLEANGADAWLVCDIGGDLTGVVRVSSRTGMATVVARLPGRARGLSAGQRSLWILVAGGLYRLTFATGEIVGPLGVTPGSTEVSAGPGRGLTLDTDAGIVLDHTLGGRVFTYNVGRGARAIAAAKTGFWISTGDAATPRLIAYLGP